MKLLIKALQLSHAIEIGAYNAYEGHWRSLPITSPERGMIKWIQLEEYAHRRDIFNMLEDLEARPSKWMDASLLIIGKAISAACYIIGYRAAMLGANLIEKMGARCYREVAAIAREAGYAAMARELESMQDTEEEHERYLKQCYLTYRVKKGKHIE